VGIAKAWVDQQKSDPSQPKPEKSDEPETVREKKSKKEKLAPVG
jgi:hypothetical protein